MLLNHPSDFQHKARQWAVLYAGAPDKQSGEGSGGATPETLRKKNQQAKEREREQKMAQYHGFNQDLVNRFVAMGFDVPQVVSAFEYVGIDKNDGQDYELEEAYMGDITARLFGEA